jgi:rhodanese-related sulfurtransferase
MRGRKTMSQKSKPTNSKSSGSKKKHHHKARRQNQLWKWIGLGSAVIVIVVAAILLIPKITDATEISAAQAYQKYQQGAFFLDVRSQDEWDQVHIANSKLIPLNELQTRMNELPDDRDIVVVCLVGKRSHEGMAIMQQAGFLRASCMTGGLIAWKAAGYPLEGSNP